MYRKATLLIIVVALTLLVAIPATATHELGHDDPERVQEVRGQLLPPGYTSEGQVYVWDRGWGSTFGLYGFMAFCHNDGGYWYWGGDDWYWHSCA